MSRQVGRPRLALVYRPVAAGLPEGRNGIARDINRIDGLGIVDVGNRIFVQHQKIGPLAVLDAADGLVTQPAGIVAGGGLDGVHGRTARQHFQLHFLMGIKAGVAAIGTGVGAHAGIDARLHHGGVILQRLEQGAVHVRENLLLIRQAGELGEAQHDRLFAVHALERLQGAGRDATGEERIVQPGHDGQAVGHFAAEGGGDLPGALALHQVQEFLVDRLIADHMAEAVNAFSQQFLGVGQIEDMRHGAQMFLVRFIDDGPGDLIGHLDRNGFALVIHPELDEVHALGRLLVDELARLLRRGDRVGHAHKAAIAAFHDGALAGAEDPRHGRAALALLVAHVEDEVLVGAQHLHRGDAVSGVLLQIGLDVLRRLVFFVLGDVMHHAEMDMAVDDAGHHELAGQIHGLGAGGRLQSRHGTDIGDLAVRHHNGGIGFGGGPGAVNHRDVPQHRGFSQGRRARGHKRCDSRTKFHNPHFKTPLTTAHYVRSSLRHRARKKNSKSASLHCGMSQGSAAERKRPPFLSKGRRPDAG